MNCLNNFNCHTWFVEHYVGKMEPFETFILYSSIQSIKSQIWHRTRQAQSAFSTLHKNFHSHYTQQRKLQYVTCGYDGISTKILKLSCPFISSPINYICNKMLFWCVFHDRLKYAIIKPLHKYDDRCEVSKYRPVSLLTSFSKIFETLLQRRILTHWGRGF